MRDLPASSENVPLVRTEQCFAEALAKSRSTSRLPEFIAIVQIYRAIGGGWEP